MKLLALVVLGMGVYAGPILSVSADLTVPINYSGPTLFKTDSASLSTTVLASGGAGNAFLALMVDGQGTIFLSPLGDGRVTFTASTDAGGGISMTTWGQPSFHCGGGMWNGCTLPITFGLPETVTMTGSAQAEYSTFEVPVNYFYGTVYANLTAQIVGVGVYDANGFNFVPGSTLAFSTEGVDTMPDPPTLALVGVGLAIVKARMRGK